MTIRRNYREIHKRRAFAPGTGGRENLGRKKFRRIVKNLDDEDGDNCVGDYDLVSSPSNVKMRHRAGSSSSNSTSTPTGRSTPKKSQRSEGHEGTRDSSVAAGSRKSENAGARVGRSRRGDEADSDGGTSSGEDNAWFKKPSKGSGTTVSSLGGKRPGDTSSIKVKRAEAMANPGKSRDFASSFVLRRSSLDAWFIDRCK